MEVGSLVQLDLVELLSLSMQLRHEANLGVPQCQDKSIHLSLLLEDLAGWRKTFHTLKKGVPINIFTEPIFPSTSSFFCLTDHFNPKIFNFQFYKTDTSS